MHPLRDLKRVVLANDNDDDRAAIREYVIENAHQIAIAFDTTAEGVLAAIGGVEDDAELARRLLQEVKRAEAEGRNHKAAARSTNAQASADVLGAVASWDGEGVQLDVPSLLASALTRRGDLLVFRCDAFEVAVYMEPLIGLARLRRSDLTGSVDRKGLHLRWGTGGLNLVPQIDAEADRIIVNLPAPAAAVAA